MWGGGIGCLSPSSPLSSLCHTQHNKIHHLQAVPNCASNQGSSFLRPPLPLIFPLIRIALETGYFYRVGNESHRAIRILTLERAYPLTKPLVLLSLQTTVTWEVDHVFVQKYKPVILDTFCSLARILSFEPFGEFPTLSRPHLLKISLCPRKTKHKTYDVPPKQNASKEECVIY